MLALEKYRGPKTRHRCPSCGHPRCFSHYVDDDGRYIHDDCGRCNRENKCGYHAKPQEFQNRAKSSHRLKYPTLRTVRQFQPPNYHTKQSLLDTLSNYDRNDFVQFLLGLFPENVEAVWNAVRSYFIGTFPHAYGAYTCFPYIDQEMQVCRGKLIRFDRETGRRRKGEFDTSSLAAKLWLKDFNYKQIFFGEHLLKSNPMAPIAIVEAEKTAVIASIYKDFPAFIWLATGTKSWLKPERIAGLSAARKIIVYPDADAFTEWSKTATEARRLGCSVSVSDVIERFGTRAEKASGFDLADYLIRDRNKLIEKHKIHFQLGATLPVRKF